MDLKQTYLELKGKNYFQILNVTTDVNATKLRTARRKLSSTYHPDKFETQEDKELAIEISSLINEAYEALTDEAFREEYVNSGMKKKHNTSHSVTVVKGPEDKLRLSKARGSTLTASATVPLQTLVKGGEVQVSPIVVEGLDIDDSPRTIKIPPNTKEGSFLIFGGLGEKSPNGNNGDLIVSVRCSEKMNKYERVINGLTANPIYIEFSKPLPKGKKTLKLSEEHSLSLEVNKATEDEEFVLIKNTTLDKPLLIKI